MLETDVFLPDELRQQAERFGNPPTAVAFAISAWIEREYRRGSARLVNSSGTWKTSSPSWSTRRGAAKKSARRPMPFVYVVMIKQLILVYLLTLPFASAMIAAGGRRW